MGLVHLGLWSRTYQNDRLHLSPLTWWVWWHPFLSVIILMVTSLLTNNNSVDITSCQWSFWQWDLFPPLTIIQVVSFLTIVNHITGSGGDSSHLTNESYWWWIVYRMQYNQVPTDKSYWWWFLPSMSNTSDDFSIGCNMN